MVNQVYYSHTQQYVLGHNSSNPVSWSWVPTGEINLTYMLLVLKETHTTSTQTLRPHAV